MIDLSQFDGHTPWPWIPYRIEGKQEWVVEGPGRGCIGGLTKEDAALIAAAPDLLAEVKRLRAALSDLICRINRDGGHAMTGDLLADAEAADAVAAERNARCDELEAELARYKEALAPSTETERAYVQQEDRGLFLSAACLAEDWKYTKEIMGAIRRRAEGK